MDVVFASETGNACDIAERIWLGARARGVKNGCTLYSCDEYGMAGLQSTLQSNRVLVIICSTAGQGDPPSNGRKFWREIMRRSVTHGVLSGLKYAPLGLGDSSYQKFNFCIKKLHRRFMQLGAVPICDVGLADDQHELGLDSVCEEWIERLWSNIGFEKQESNYDDVVLPPRYNVTFIDENGSIPNVSNDNANDDNLVKLEVVGNERVTADDHWQDTRLISFGKCPTVEQNLTQWDFLPGDVLVLKPRNLIEASEMFINATKCHGLLDKKFMLTEDLSGIQVPSELRSILTLRTLLNQYFDLQAVPRRGLLKWLYLHTSDIEEKERLSELCTNLDDYFDYCCRPRRTLAETLRDFPNSAKSLPFEYYFDAIPVIRARSFSIASAPQDPHLELLVTIVNYRSQMSTPRLGLCSNWLARCQIGTKVSAEFRKGSLKFPLDIGVSETPACVMVGPGTGVAPFRSFLRYSAKRVEYAPKHVLFFGCRNQRRDFYFENEWDKLPVKIVCAFSRDTPNKVYVQHKIMENSALVSNMLGSGAMFYIAGNAKDMPEAVLKSLAQIAMNFGLADNFDSGDNGQKFVDALVKSGRLQMETWS